MNTWQTVRQLRHLLQQVQWPGTDNYVFASRSVLVSSAFEQEAASGLRFPVAMIAPGAGSTDPDHGGERPSLIRRTIQMRILHAVSGDRFGQASMIGANQIDENASSGKGLLQIEEMALGAVKDLGPQNGVSIWLRLQDAPQIRPLGDSYVIAGDYQLEAYVTDARSYPPVNGLQGAIDGSTIRLSWRNPGARFDRRDIAVRYRTGHLAPTSPEEGETIALGVDLLENAAINVGPGTYSFSVFARYDDDFSGESEPRRFARAASITVVMP